MATAQTILLAALQGLTEFLPISSSGHLILVPSLLAWPDQGLAFDIAVHLGTLIAVLVYFRREIVALLGAWLASFSGVRSAEARLAWGILLATVPVVVFGLLLKDWIEGPARAPMLIASTTAGFGVLLWLAAIYSIDLESYDYEPSAGADLKGLIKTIFESHPVWREGEGEID